MDTDDSLVAFYIADYIQEGYSNEYCDKLLFITVYKGDLQQYAKGQKRKGKFPST